MASGMLVAVGTAVAVGTVVAVGAGATVGLSGVLGPQAMMASDTTASAVAARNRNMRSEDMQVILTRDGGNARCDTSTLSFVTNVR